MKSDKQKMSRLVYLSENKYHQTTRVLLPAAFILTGILWFTASMLGIQKHEIYLYVITGVAIIVLYFQIIEYRQIRKEIKELKTELEVE